MAENLNLPSGAVPPKPAEAAKVQPKKETVRINLPPKPTASPTIKLPTLPTGAPAQQTTSAAAPVAPAPGTGPKPLTPPTSGAPGTRVAAAPPTAQRSAVSGPPAPAPRQAPSQGTTVSGLDKILAVLAALASLAALGAVAFLAFLFNTHPGS